MNRFHQSTVSHLLRAVTIVLGLAIAGHGFYLDYSDRLWHASAAAVFIIGCVFRPKVSVFAACLWSLGIASFWLLTPPHEFPAIATGTTRAAIEQRLGPPQRSFPSLDALLADELGYSKPSPLRFRRDSAVSVYFQDDAALYVLFAENHVVGTFVGGS